MLIYFGRFLLPPSSPKLDEPFISTRWPNLAIFWRHLVAIIINSPTNYRDRHLPLFSLDFDTSSACLMNFNKLCLEQFFLCSVSSIYLLLCIRMSETGIEILKKISEKVLLCEAWILHSFSMKMAQRQLCNKYAKCIGLMIWIW
jgi:hypothetical protein